MPDFASASKNKHLDSVNVTAADHDLTNVTNAITDSDFGAQRYHTKAS